MQTRVAPAPPAVAGRETGRVIASPLARRRAREAGLDLRRVAGSGPGGRIKLRDLAPALARRPEGGGALPVFMLHGFAADSLIWSALAAELGRGRRLIRPDLPAHGAAPAPAEGGLEAVVAPVLAALDAETAPKLHVVGHSLGGAVALCIARERPARIASLTLIAPAGLGPEIDGATLDGIGRATRPESLLPWLQRLVADPRRIDDAYARAALSARSADLRAAQARLAARLFPDGTQGFDLRAALGGAPMPLRLVWGREDAILPWRHALAAPDHAALHLLRGVGHMPHVEAPALVARLLRDAMAAAEAAEPAA